VYREQPAIKGDLPNSHISNTDDGAVEHAAVPARGIGLEDVDITCMATMYQRIPSNKPFTREGGKC